MEIIPGMDIINHKVTLAENIPWIPSLASNHDPIEVAKYWKSLGAEHLYIADMEGARLGMPITFDIVKEIINKVGIKVYLGGGIRSYETAEKAFDIGVEKLVIGTSLAFTPEFAKDMFDKYGDKIIATLGNLNGYVAVQDWTVRLDETIFEFSKKLKDMGCKYIVYNDISRKGAHGGPNFNMIENMVKTVSDINLLVGCGVSSIGDIERLRDMNIPACIMVTALYSRMIDYKEAVVAGKAK